MAKIKLGSLISEASGSLGGHTIQHSKGGMQLRTKPIPANNPTASQSLIRSLNHQLQKGWRDLTNAQRTVWNDWAKSHDLQSNGSIHNILSGHSLWMKYCFAYYQVTGSLMSYPWELGPPWYGPELIINGAFDGQPPWTGAPSWTFLNGKANFLDLVTQPIYQPVNYFHDIHYKMSFDISNCPTVTGIRFIYPGQIHVFKPPYNIYFILPNGHYEYEVVPELDRTIFYISGSVTRDVFSIDNFSFKQVF
jgi:hypothetical protein